MAGGTNPIDDAKLIELEGLVRSVANRVRTRLRLRVDHEDLVQLGMVGLLEAAQRHDPDSGVQLSSFAYTRIRGAILDGIGDLTGVKRAQLRRLKRLAAANEFVESNDHSASDASDAQYVSLAVQGVLVAVDLSEILDSSSGNDEASDSPLKTSPERSLGRRQMRVLVQQVMDDLPDDERTLLRAHYVEGKTLSSVADSLGVSRSWMSRVHTRALKRMREQMETMHGIEASDLSDATYP